MFESVFENVRKICPLVHSTIFSAEHIEKECRLLRRLSEEMMAANGK